jgi:uncharacterized protein with von Willebrand factor type A (vWA) domain
MLTSPKPLCEPLAALETLGKNLWLPVIPNAHSVPSPNSVALRLEACCAIRARLMEGKTPFVENETWPSAEVCAAFGAKFKQLTLTKYSRNSESFTDQVLKVMLWHLDSVPRLRDQGASESEALTQAAQGFAAEWEDMSAELEEAYKIFDSLGDGLRFLRWDLTKGTLHREAWEHLLAIRALLERLPAIKNLITELGRSEPSDLPPEPSLQPTEVLREQQVMTVSLQKVKLPEREVETSGVRRSARVERMLPQEGVTLSHPVLKWLWHARRVERALLTFDDEARSEEPMPTPQAREIKLTVLQPKPRLTCGPMIVVVDTSGSMFGAPEGVAKACVLQAMRVAHAQKRPCYVIGFGGPGELFTRELKLDSEGIEALLDFMSQSFGGGTDVADPLEHALGLVEREQWRLADVLIASDGEFGVTRDVLERLREAKAQLGLRVQAVLIADRRTMGLNEIADHIFWLKDWRKYGLAAGAPTAAPHAAEEAAATPVHAENLTQLYFPNAGRI